MAVSQSLTLTQSSQSVANNTSQVRILWQSTQTAGSYNNYTRTAKYYVSINGGAEVVYNVTYQLPKTSTVAIVDITITVPHNTDGTGSVRVRTWMDTDISAGVIEQTKTLALTTIPRATTPTFHTSSVDMGGTMTIYLNRASTNFTHDLAYSFAGGSYVSIVTGATTVHYWATPDLSAQIPNATSGTVTVRCITKSGSTVIGTKTATFTLKVPVTDYYSPKINSVTVTEATAGLAAQFGVFVKSRSTLSVSVSATGVNGATIKSCTTTLDGKSYTGTSFTFSPLSTAGTLSMVTTVVDSRGRSQKQTTTINVLDYYTPAISLFRVYRVNTNGVADSDGTRAGLSWSYIVAPVGGRNTCSFVVQIKRSTATSWTTLANSTVLNETWSGTSTSITLSTDYQYDVRATLTDWFGASATYTATIPTANVIMDIKANGQGISFGKTAEYDGLEVDMPTFAESFKMLGIRNYEQGPGHGYILYNNGLLLQWGSVSVTPTAINTVTALTVAFPIPYETRPHITGTILVNSPQVVSWSMGVGTTEAAAVSSLVIYMSRSTLHATPFRWLAVGKANMAEVGVG